MSNIKIGRPGSSRGSGFVKDDHEDHLLAFIGITLEQDVSTSFGDSDAARVETIVCLDHPALFNDQLIFGTALVPALTDSKDNDVVLARLVKGQAMPGRNAPWLLDDPTEMDEKHAEEFFEQYASRLKSGRIMVELPPAGDDEKF